MGKEYKKNIKNYNNDKRRDGRDNAQDKEYYADMSEGMVIGRNAVRELLKSGRDIDKILVVTGPGSFTGVRIGVTIAKTYAYLNKIDIVL